MTNLVTGATGLVGSNLCRYLISKGESVYALYRKTSRFDLLDDIYNDVNWIEGDLQDVLLLSALCQSVDVVYHAAAKVSYQKKEIDLMYASNVSGTGNLVDAALYGKVKKLLYVSSIAALGKLLKPKTIINEQNEPESWNSKYGHSKYLGELEVWRAQAEGLSTVVINPSVIIGGGYWNSNSGKLFTQLHKGFPYYSKGSTGFVDVRDVVKIMYQLMHSTIEEKRFVVSAENWTYKDFFREIALQLNVKSPNKSPGKFLQQLALTADWFKSALTNQPRFLTQELIQTANTLSVYDNSKLTDLLSYKYLPLDQTISETADLFRKSKSLGQDFAYFNSIEQ